MDINDPQFYTPEQVAKILQVKTETVRRYVRSGELKAIKLGGKFIRIDNKDLEAFINEMRVKK